MWCFPEITWLQVNSSYREIIFLPAGESICIFDYMSQSPMLIKLHWRCASNPNKVCSLQKSNGSSNGERGVKVEGIVSLPSGKICMGSFSQQMSTASRNPTPQVRLYLHALHPASLHCLSTPFQASGGLSYSIIFPTSSFPVRSKTCAWCVFSFFLFLQSLSWDMEIKKTFPKVTEVD